MCTPETKRPSLAFGKVTRPVSGIGIHGEAIDFPLELGKTYTLSFRINCLEKKLIFGILLPAKEIILCDAYIHLNRKYEGEVSIIEVQPRTLERRKNKVIFYLNQIEKMGLFGRSYNLVRKGEFLKLDILASEVFEINEYSMLLWDSKLILKEEIERDPSKLLKKVRKDLRIFVDRKLTEAHGSDWVETPRFKKFKKNWKKFEERERKKRVGKYKKYSLIHYSNFKDLKKLIQSDWKLFKPYFKTQQSVATWLDELSAIRDPDAHGREWTNNEKQRIELYYLNIQSAIHADSRKPTLFFK